MMCLKVFRTQSESLRFRWMVAGWSTCGVLLVVRFICIFLLSFWRIIHSRLETPPVSIHVGMVQDGSMCGIDSICIGSECVPVSKVMPVKCPTGLNGLICSGQGVRFHLLFLPQMSSLDLPSPRHFLLNKLLFECDRIQFVIEQIQLCGVTWI